MWETLPILNATISSERMAQCFSAIALSAVYLMVHVASSDIILSSANQSTKQWPRNQNVRNPADLKCNYFLRANGSMFFRNCSLSSLFDGSCSIIGYHFKLGKPVNKAVAKKSKCEKPCRSQMQLFPQSEWLNVFPQLLSQQFIWWFM